ncbi:MAG: cobalamin B12-binding domain-containing protein [Firmicutes bacterium]|nr:cobalamin B12-binding domain-containing protein [Bacillota bacterium]
MPDVDVLLVHPPWSSRLLGNPEENLGLAYLAACLRERGHRVEILDASLQGLSMKALIGEIRNRTFRVLGISVLFQVSMPEAVRIAAAAREGAAGGGNRNRIHVTVGGHFPTFEAERLLADFPVLDSVVRGEGEETLPELVETLRSGGQNGANGEGSGGGLEGIRGLVFRRDGEVVVNPPRPLIADLDRLPFPARDLTPLAVRRGVRPAVLTSRGCYGLCSFCSIRAFYDSSPGKAWRGRSPAGVVDELAELARMGIRSFHFNDDNFVGAGRRGAERAAAIAEEILRRGLKVGFAVSCRANDVREDLFKILKKAGLREVFLGIESGVQRVLNDLRKDVTVDENLAAVETLRKLDLRPRLGFIMFDPDATVEEIHRNVAFLKRLGVRWGAMDTLTDVLNRLHLFSGTPVVERLRRQGRLGGSYLAPTYRFSDPGVETIYRLTRVFQNLTLPLHKLRTRLRRHPGPDPWEERVG